MDQSGIIQVIMATHSPMLMAYPNARLLRLTKYGLDPVRLEDTDHFRLWREFCADPETFVQTALEE
jgi:predicted ATPase